MPRSIHLVALLSLLIAGCSFTVDGLTGDQSFTTADLATAPRDLAGADFAGVDFAGVDLAPPVDLTPPADLAHPPDLTPPPDLAPPADLRPIVGLLTGSFVASDNTSVNLTTDGTLDWVHWGYATNRKMGVTAQITNAIIGGGGTVPFGDSSVTYAWNDGTPVLTATGIHDGLYINNSSNGFSVTVPAAVGTNKLEVYLSSYKADLALTAHLSDSSAADYTSSNTGSSTGPKQLVYTFTFHAASAGQQLTVSWTDTHDYPSGGNVTLQAAALQ